MVIIYIKRAERPLSFKKKFIKIRLIQKKILVRQSHNGPSDVPTAHRPSRLVPLLKFV